MTALRKISDGPSNSQLATIHTLAKKAGLDEDAYRGFLEKHTGRQSAKNLTASEAGGVIEKLREAAGEAVGKAVAGLDTPVGKKLRALWIAGYDLGIVQARHDSAMLSFVERQTGVSHIRFLQKSRDGNAAIEGLKAWLARKGQFTWPADTRDARAAKVAVIEAQWMTLYRIGDVQPFIKDDPMPDLMKYSYRVTWISDPLHRLPEDKLDELQNALGRRLRAAIPRRAAMAEQAGRS